MDLARFDVVVLDPHAHPPLPLVKRHGSLLLTYVSLGEVNTSHPEFAAIAGEPWVLLANPSWPDARRLDVRAPAYERWLLDRVVPAALAGPVNGLFLDTADTALDLEQTDPRRFAGAAQALERVLVELKRRHPRALLMINGGLPVAERLPTVLDAVALESIWTDYDFKAKAYRVRPAEEAESRALLLDPGGRAGPAGVHARVHRGRPRRALARGADPPLARPGLHPVRLHDRPRPGLDPHPRPRERTHDRKAVAPRPARALGRRGGRPGAPRAAGARPARGAGRARPEHAGPGELPRYVLALYKSAEISNDVDGRRPKTATLNEIHSLGPDAAQLARAHGGVPRHRPRAAGRADHVALPRASSPGSRPRRWPRRSSTCAGWARRSGPGAAW